MGKKKSILAVSVILLLITAAAAVFYLFWGPGQNDEGSMEINFTKQGELCFNDRDGRRKARIDIEIADDEQKRATGLMWRQTMGEEEGMLFIFDKPDIQSFWMKNTYLPLDMLFLDSEFRVINIAKNTAPLTETAYSSKAPAKFVLEVNGGYSDRHGISEGDMLSYKRF